MLFPSFDFLLFIIPVLVVYWTLSGRPMARVLFLLGASYFFYMAGPKTSPPPAPPYYVGLLIFSTLLDFFAGREIHRHQGDLKSEDEGVKRRATSVRNRWLLASLVGNLGLLMYFKYINFFLEAVIDIVNVFGVDAAALHLDIILPLGISFYTFQSLSYTIDIWRQRLEPELSLRRFALFVVFFPQLVAGPIVRASEFLPQLRQGPKFSRENFETGAFRICKGLAKKVILGDWIAVHLTDRIFDAPGTYTSLELLVALYAYTLQLYADFSGYSDIAIGLGLMLGFKLPENFDRPYQSRDIAEYWRRWHMTLSTWLRDYLFFPLLARLGAKGGYFILWLTMYLVGMWHGASWNFVIFANIHAGAMVFNRWNRMRPKKPIFSDAKVLGKWTLGLAVGAAFVILMGKGALRLEWTEAVVLTAFMLACFLFVCWLPATRTKLNTSVHIFATFHLVVFSRIFFRAPDLETSTEFISGLASLDAHGLRPGLVSPQVWAALLFGIAFHFTPRDWVDKKAHDLFREIPGFPLGVLFIGFTYILMKLLEGMPRAFIYFQF